MITLGIIGVVAALTMPTLISNHRKKEVETKLAKVYSVMNQAIKLTNNEFGEPAEWIKYCGSSSSPTCTSEEVKDWFISHIGKYLQYTKIEVSEDNDGALIYLNDGSILMIENYLYDYHFYINKKAVDNPKVGVNTFFFKFNPVILEHQKDAAQQQQIKYALKPTLEPQAWGWDGTREGLLDESNANACHEGGGGYCSKLIQYEGWKIPDDYPFKF